MAKLRGTALLTRAANDVEVLTFWLAGRSARTVRECTGEVTAFLGAIGKPLQAITLGDVLTYVATRSGYRPPTQALTIIVLKCLFGFAQRIDYVTFNIATPLR